MGDPAVLGAAGETTLAISGPVTLGEVSRWRDALLGALGAAQPVNLNLADAGPWDAAGLQLIVSAVTTGRSVGPPVRLCRVPQVFLSLADQAGAADWLADVIVDRLD